VLLQIMQLSRIVNRVRRVIRRPPLHRLLHVPAIAACAAPSAGAAPNQLLVVVKKACLSGQLLK
jgi:hypothetical protein